MTRRQSSDIRAFLLGLVHNTKVGNLGNVDPRGNYVMQPLLRIDHRRVLSCLHYLHRNCIASDAGLRSRCVHGGVHLGVLPVLHRLGPSIDRDVTRASEHLASISLVCGGRVRTKGREIVRGSNRVLVSHLVRRDIPTTLLFRVLRPLNFGSIRMKSMFHDLSTRSKGEFISTK